MSVTLAIAYLNVAIWLYLLFVRGTFWQAKPLDTTNLTSPEVWPDIALIIPARNEADTLEYTLPSVLKNDYPGKVSVVLVDDRSEDGTAAVARSIAQSLNAADRLNIVSALPLPSDWKGKVWAMQCGIEHIINKLNPPRYILFTDADIAYDKGAIIELVKHAEANNLVLDSLMVSLRCKSFAERLFVPAFVYFFQMLYPFNWVNRPTHKLAAAAGGCMLVRFDALQKAGMLESIRNALIDDCALGRLMKLHGNIFLSLTRSVHSMREYPYISDIRQMVARTAYDQLNYSVINLIGTIAGLLITFMAPVLLTVFANGFAQALGIIAWACIAISFVPMLRFYHRPILESMLLPIIALFYMAFTLDSAYQYICGKGGLWKGRIQAPSVKRTA